jgi:poly(beta-D-mannuronate) lyase
MQLGILLNDNKLFKKLLEIMRHAIRYQRKDGSMPIETRRGGRAMFYQGRAMTALTTIAIIAENQGYNIWDYEYKGKNFHNIVKFFIDFTENNEIVFKYAKEMKAPGPAKDYKRQDVNGSSSSQWGWLYAYATRFPNHENIQRLKQWSS